MVSSQFRKLLQLLYIFISLTIVILMTTETGTAERIDVVETDPTVKLQNGSFGQLLCRVSVQPFGVYWTRGPTYVESITIMFMDPTITDDIRGGPGYEDGSYNMTDGFTLVIDEVTFENEDLYFCSVVYNNEVIYNESSVLVYVLPEEPFPTIANCLNDTDAVRKGQNCSIYGSQLSHNITCSVWGYTPDIAVLIYIQQESQRLEVLDVSEWPDGNRTVGRSVTVMANASFEPYECRASYVTIKGELVEKSTTITLRYRPEQPPEGHHRPKEISLILALFLFSCIIPLMFVYVLALRQVEEELKRRSWDKMTRDLLWDIPKIMRIVFKLILFPLRSSFYYYLSNDLRHKPDLETFAVFFSFVISYTMLPIGVLYRSDCPVEDNIPIYLIVMGSTSILLSVIYLILRYLWISRLRYLWTSWYNKFWKSRVGMLVIIVIVILGFIIIFLVAGTVWLSQIFWPNMKDTWSPQYCHPIPFYFLLLHMTFALICYVCCAVGVWINIYDKDLIALCMALSPMLSTAMIIIGVKYKDDCPAESLIPVYLIVMGSTSALFCTLALKLRYHKLQYEDITDSCFLVVIAIIASLICCFMFIFFITGNVWIYRIKWPNMSDPTSPEYCHRTLYLFSFWITTSIYILIGFIIVVIVAIILRRQTG